jgi:hypothetical protein
LKPSPKHIDSLSMRSERREAFCNGCAVFSSDWLSKRFRL